MKTSSSSSLTSTDAELVQSAYIMLIMTKLRDKGFLTDEECEDIHKEAKYLATLKKYNQMQEREKQGSSQAQGDDVGN